jgi:glycosyltransferase involved in cell wall biosynthesis
MADFEQLRVMLVGPLPPPAGGMANQTRQLAELLRGRGASVELVQTNAPYRPAFVGRIPVARAFFRLLPYAWVLWRAAGRADVVHVMANSGWSWHLFAAPAVWLAWLRRVPTVINYRGGEAASFLARSESLVRFTLRRCAALVVPSGFLEAVFRQHGVAAAVVPNIVDTERFAPGQNRRSDVASPCLLVARNLEELYGNDVALRAFAKLRLKHPKARLRIAGSGPLGAELLALARQLGVADAVEFTGRVDRDRMAVLLQEADVAINPSRVDNMPNSVLEALAAGVPVVSTRVGGVPFVVRDEETALLVAPDDADAMAEALGRVLSDPALAHRLAAAGLADVQRYTWARIAPQWADVYRGALAGRSLGGAVT